MYKSIDDVVEQVQGDAMEGILHTQEGRGKNRIDYFLFNDVDGTPVLYRVDAARAKRLLTMLNDHDAEQGRRPPIDFDFNLVRWLRKNAIVGIFE